MNTQEIIHTLEEYNHTIKEDLSKSIYYVEKAKAEL
jgi:hypothetical protein